MTSQEFFDSLIRLYRSARVPTYEHAAIRRGRCRSVSGGLEDLVASWVVAEFPNKYLAYVDQYVNLGDKPVMYVDVLLIDRDTRVVHHFIDAKTDLGWSSHDLERLSEHFTSQVQRSRSVTLELMDESGATQKYSVSSEAQCHIVVATKVNGRGIEEARLREAERKHGVNIYVLSRGKHPNEFSRGEFVSYPRECIAEVEFNRLRLKLQ